MGLIPYFHYLLHNQKKLMGLAHNNIVVVQFKNEKTLYAVQFYLI